MLRRLSSAFVVLCMLGLLLPFGAASASTPRPATRVAGSSRYDTADKVIQIAFPSTTATTVVLTSGASGSVSALANSLAGSLHAPLLFTMPQSLDFHALQQLQRLGATRAIIVGGSTIVSGATESSLASMGISVTRYGGTADEDVARNVAVACSTEATSFSKRAFVVASEPVIDPRTLYSVASLSYSQAAPILFTGYSSVPTATMQTIASTGIDHVTIVGSDRYVSDTVVSQLASAGVSVDRIAETARRGLSAAAAEYAVDKGWASFSTVVLGSYDRFPDELAGPEAAAVKGGVFMTCGNDGACFAVRRAIGRHLGEVVNKYELGFPQYAGVSDAAVAQAYSGYPASTVMTGTVVSDETSLPLAGIRVTAYGWDETDPVFRVFHANEATTGADGTFRIDGLEPGHYWLTYSDPSGTYQGDSYPNAPSTPSHGDVAFASRGGVTIQSVGTPRATVLESLFTRTAWKQQRIVRLQGPSRYDTALEISRKSFRRSATAVLVTGNGFADALSASALCGAYRAPLLLTPTNQLPKGLVGELNRLGVRKVFIVGGESVVSAGVAGSLSGQGFTVKRIKGATRYETSANVYRYLHDTSGLPTMSPDPFIVRGDTFPDALSAAPFAYRQVRPILLTLPKAAPGPLKQVFIDYRLTSAIVVGGTPAVSNDVIFQIGDATKTNIATLRLQGGTRYLTALAVARHFGSSYDFIGVATGQNYPDALGGGVLAGARGGALVLTPTASLDGGARDFIRQNYRGLQQLRLFGSTVALSKDVESGASSAANGH